MRAAPYSAGALIVAMLAAAPWVLSASQLSHLTEILYFSLFAISYNLLFGYAGMLSFGHSATFGFAAYAFGILLNAFPSIGVPLVGAMALVIGAAGGTLMGALCSRLRGGYLAVMTLAFAQLLYVAASVWRDVTRGDDGLSITLSPTTLPTGGTFAVADVSHMYGITLAVTGLAALAGYWLMGTAYGSSVALIRENEERARFIGYKPFAIKMFVFALASVLASVAGILFIMDQRLVSPEVFGIPINGDVLIMVLLGGTRAYFAPVLGVVFYKIFQNLVSNWTTHWPFFVGLSLVLMVLFSRDGLWGLAQRIVRRRGS